MASDPSMEDEVLLDPFAAAEAAAETVIEQVLTEGGKMLYDAYIARKSFPFAAEVVTNILAAELQMYYVRVDLGEEPYRPKRAPPTPTLPARAIPRAQSSQGAPRSLAAAVAAAADCSRPGTAPAGTFSQSQTPTSARARSSSGARNSPVATAANRVDSPLSRALASKAAQNEAVFMDLSNDTADMEADPSDPRSAWAIEAEPARCRIDTWARACVPVRKKIVQPKSAASPDNARRGFGAKRTPSLASTPSVLGSLGRTGSRFGLSSMLPEMLQSEGRGLPVNRVVPLDDEREENEEEDALREMKEREARRHREGEVKALKKAALEEEEAARLAQAKDAKFSKPFTYDSEGNIIWVQPPAVSSLPNTTPVPNFICKTDKSDKQDTNHHATHSPNTNFDQPLLRIQKKRGKPPREEKFADSFKKFPAQQPSMMEAMQLAPGVQLKERNGTKRGPPLERPGEGVMSRKEYQDMVALTSQRKGQPAAPGQSPALPTADLPKPTPATVTLAPLQGLQESPRGPVQQPLARTGTTSDGAMKVVRSDMGSDMVPPKPATPRSVQPAPPPSYRRVQGKRDALGYALSSRERAVTGQGTRFPGCGAQPPIGATMGHGLLTTGEKYEEYYFPNASPTHGRSLEGLDEVSPRAQTSPRTQGEIVSQNPELKSRLFGKLR